MSLKVLVVDDEPDVVKLIKSVVERLDCTVVATSDSKQAAERIESEKLDGILLDVGMPNPDGFELAKRARASRLNSTVPIVLFTGRNDLDTMRQGFKAGATCFLGKPVTADRITKLFEAIRGAMLRERRRHQRLPYQTPVECKAGARHFKSTSVSINEGGMVVLDTSGGMRVGEEVLLEFKMPEAAQPSKVCAKVTSNEPPDSIGVEFLDLSASDGESIQRYIAGSAPR